MEFIFAYLEYFVAAGGAIGTVAFLKFRHIGPKKNNLSRYMVKINRHNKSITERSKSVI